jgi:hypothetical protein
VCSNWRNQPMSQIRAAQAFAERLTLLTRQQNFDGGGVTLRCFLLVVKCLSVGKVHTELVPYKTLESNCRSSNHRHQWPQAWCIFLITTYSTSSHQQAPRVLQKGGPDSGWPGFSHNTAACLGYKRSGLKILRIIPY